MERWAEHPVYKGYWFSTEGGAWREGYVSDMGRYDRNGQLVTRNNKQQHLTRSNGPGNYPIVMVSRIVNGKRKFRTRRVHILVMETFVGPLVPGMVTRHLNADRWDARLCNLAYGTAAENARDTVLIGNNPRANKTRCPLGHLYLGPNLYEQKTRVQRTCIACRRARKNCVDRGYGVGRESTIYVQWAHEQYRNLMADFVLPEGVTLWAEQEEPPVSQIRAPKVRQHHAHVEVERVVQAPAEGLFDMSVLLGNDGAA